MNWRYTLSEPTLGEEEIAAAVDCLRSGWLSMGPRTQEFEARFAEATGARHAIAVGNGTAALHLAMLALDLSGGEIIQPAINFVASANMTKAVGAMPVFADILSLTEPTIDPAEIERKITKRTRAVVVMHFGGYPSRMEEIAKLCRRHELILIEDACHAPLVAHRGMEGRSLGTIGDVGCFSFFSNKNMTTGEGGMVVTDDDMLAERLRRLRSHGMTTLSWQRHHGRPSTYDVVAHGLNYRIDDLRSAIGLVQLGRLPEGNRRRQELAALYASEVERLCGGRAHAIFGHDPKGGAAHLFGVVVEAHKRDAIRQALAASGIQTSLHYPPIHRFSAFSDFADAALPVSEEFAARMITLPLYAGLSPEGVTDIVSALAGEVVQNAA